METNDKYWDCARRSWETLFKFKERSKNMKNQQQNPHGNGPLVKFAYILLGVFMVTSALLLSVGYMLYINGINPFK